MKKGLASLQGRFAFPSRASHTSQQTGSSFRSAVSGSWATSDQTDASSPEPFGGASEVQMPQVVGSGAVPKALRHRPHPIHVDESEADGLGGIQLRRGPQALRAAKVINS